MSDLRLVGFEELSAVALRDRLLARRAEFWSDSPLDDEAVRALHDPLFFHQLGGFGAHFAPAAPVDPTIGGPVERQQRPACERRTTWRC